MSQKHISVRISGSYPVSKAIELLETASKSGFGDVITYETQTHRKAQKFRKRSFDGLDPPAKRILEDLRISREMYTASTESPSTEE